MTEAQKGIKLNPKTISDLTIPKNATPQEIDTALKQWLSQLGGNYVKAYDGELVHFNTKGNSHIIYDCRQKWITAMAVGQILEVLIKGKPSQLVGLKHDRSKDNMTQFKTYRKQCKIENLIADIEVIVGKLPKDKKFKQDAGKLIAYSLNVSNKKALEKELKESFTSAEFSSKLSSAGNRCQHPKGLKTEGSAPQMDDIIIRNITDANTTLILDDAQAEVENVIIVSVKNIIDPHKQKIARLNWQLARFIR